MTDHTLVTELDELHDFYVVAINHAVEDDDTRLAHELAERYDTDATTLVAQREGLTHLLPLRRPTRPASSLRRGVARLARRADGHTLWAFNPSPALSGRHSR